MKIDGLCHMKKQIGTEKKYENTKPRRSVGTTGSNTAGMLPQPFGNIQIIYETWYPRHEHMQNHHLCLNYASTVREGFSGEQGYTPLKVGPTTTPRDPDMSTPVTNPHTPP